MNRSLKTLVCCAATALCVQHSYSQYDTTKLEELSLKQLLSLKVTTASRTEQPLQMVAASVVVVSKEQIRMRGYRSLLDVLYDLPDVKVDDKIYSGIRNSITIRGIQGAQNFVMLINGSIISTPSGEAMPIMENYPVHLAEQIEIMYGPASALYGANAVSGVINIITKQASTKKLVVEASSIAGTYGYTNTTLFISKKLNTSLYLTVAGQYLYDKGPDYSKLYNNDSLYDMTSHRTGTFNTVFGPMTPKEPVKPQFEMPMEAYNIYVGVRSDHFSLNFFRNHFKLTNGYENNPSNTVYNKDVFISQNVTMANASYKRTFGKVTSTTNLMASEYHLDPSSNYRNLYTNMDRAYKYATSSLIKAEQQADIMISPQFQLSGGLGYEAFSAVPQSADLAAPVDTKSFISGSIAGTQSFYKPQGLPAQFYFLKFQNVGSFMQAQYEAGAKWHFTLGARYDINSRYGQSFNPRLGIVYKPARGTTIKVLYGSAFLAPSPSTAYVQYGSFYTPDSGRTYHSNFLHLPNPGLKPIRAYNAELNISQQLTDNLIFTASGWYTLLNGLYAYADDNATTQLYHNNFNGIPVDYIEVFVNRNKQRNIGGNVQLNWKHYFGTVRLNTYASFSYVDGVIQDDAHTGSKDMETDFIAPFMARVGADVKIGRFSVAPRLLLMGRQRLPGIGNTSTAIIRRQTIAGYQLLNISMRYQVNRKWAVFTNVTNALDQRYHNVSFNMDLTKSPTELFYGQHQDPVRVMGGVSVGL